LVIGIILALTLTLATVSHSLTQKLHYKPHRLGVVFLLDKSLDI